jgi:hypothetical protein
MISANYTNAALGLFKLGCGRKVEKAFEKPDLA